MSGPAGGAKGVADTVAQYTPYKKLITLDMGGTSTDCTLIYDGKPQLRRETVVDTCLDTLCWESAGAKPGPACYGKGGKQATVTDVNLVLGYLPKTLLGGEFALDMKSAVSAVESIATQMGLPVTQTAEDIIKIVNETMYGALRLVLVEQGYDPREFALVAFGGAGPLHANAVGKLLGAWPVIIPQSPGTLCAQGDVTTKLSHEQSATFIRLLADTTATELREQYAKLEQQCRETLQRSASTESWPVTWNTKYQADLRYKGQELTVTVDLQADELALDSEAWHADSSWNSCDWVLLEDASPNVKMQQLDKATSSEPPADAKLGEQTIIVEGKEQQATLWDRYKISKDGIRVSGPCIVTEMDSNTLILPGYYGEIDSIGNILIRPIGEETTSSIQQHNDVSPTEFVRNTPLIPTLVPAALSSIRGEMDKMMLRCSMSPAIREQQDEFNVITDSQGKMLVGQFGSFITQFLEVWHGTIEDGDVFITNDVYSHLNDVIVLLPIFYEDKLIGWASQFGHLTDVGGIVPGSMSINATSVFDDGIQVPLFKLYSKGVVNSDLLELLCRNSRQPAWCRSDITAIIAACSMAATRVRELATRFGCEVYLAACDELLYRNRTGFAKIIERQFDDKESTFTDFVDDDGHGVGPWALTCSMKKAGNHGLKFDWSGTSPQSSHSINFYLSETMFKMFIGYYLIAAAAPGTVINDGFHDLIDVYIPEGTVLKPVRPAPISCRTHFLGRTLDMIQALIGQKDDAYQAAAGFSDSPYFFYSGFKPNGEWYQLYQIGFGGVPARQVGDGPDCHCLFSAIKSIPTESIELNHPLRIEANGSVPDTGGPGFYRGGNAQRTLYRFLSRCEISLHDDRWFTKPWGLKGGKPGQRSRKALYRHSTDDSGVIDVVILPSKCDHVRVNPGDLLEWTTWGGGGLGDPLTRPAEKVALEVQRNLVTIKGARTGYGVVLNDGS
ncbi:hypothetical protein SI65_02101 [Aspergillus cristatus]|nr:hypothetical protein SI65_02101 [Aspergillus cristatus]